MASATTALIFDSMADTRPRRLVGRIVPAVEGFPGRPVSTSSFSRKALKGVLFCGMKLCLPCGGMAQHLCMVSCWIAVTLHQIRARAGAAR